MREFKNSLSRELKKDLIKAQSTVVENPDSVSEVTEQENIATSDNSYGSNFVSYYVYDMSAKSGIGEHCIKYGIINNDIEKAKMLALQRGGGVIYSVEFRFNGEKVGNVKREAIITPEKGI